MNLGSVFSGVSQKFFGGKKEPVESFVALKVGIKSLTAAVWSIEKGKVEIGSVAVSSVIDETLDGLINAADEAISQVVADITPEPQKIIFGVSEDWIFEGKIKQDHLTDLRTLCKKLDLRPMGFVTVSEAVDNFLKEVEGVPMTAILVGIDHNKLQVTIIRAGKNFGSVSEPFEGDLAGALEKAIRRFTDVEFLPSRIIIYNGKSDLESSKQKIVSYPWTQRLPFLHFPKVEILPTEEVVKAVAIAGGMQLGGSLDISKVDWGKNEKTEVVFDKIEQEDPMPQSTETNPANNLEGLNSQEPVDIILEEANRDELKSNEFEEVSPEEMGFEVEKDDQVEEILNDVDSENINHEQKSSKQNVLSGFSSFVSKFKKPNRAGSSFSRVAQTEIARTNKKPLLILVLILVVLMIGAVGFLYYVPSAKVTIYVSPKALNKTLDINVSLGGSGSGSASAMISGKTVETNLSGTKKGVATGKKLVGTKASGPVILYSVGVGKTFAAGTVISSPEGLKFTLDKEVSVASGDAITPATVSVGVGAVDIGEKYNLPAGTKFSIGSLSSLYLAKNDSAFTGGSSHLATVVTKEDQSRLSATVSAELDSRAKGELVSKLGVGETLLDKAITSSIVTKKFSRDVDSEADSITLDLTMKFTGVVFDQKDAAASFRDNIGPEIPSGYSLNLDDVRSDLLKVTPIKNDGYMLSMSFNANSLPHVSTDEIKSKIAGKSLKDASKLIEDINGVSGSEIVFVPKFVSFINLLPFRTSQISIDVVSR